MAAEPAAAAGEVVAAVHCSGECLLEVRLPSAALASANIAQLKQQTMDFMCGVLKQQNMDTEEVLDLMEEVVSDGDGEGGAKPAGAAGKGGKKGRGGGKKRKQRESPKT